MKTQVIVLLLAVSLASLGAVATVSRSEVEELKGRLAALEGQREITLSKVVLDGDLVFETTDGQKIAGLVYNKSKRGYDWNLYNRKGKLIATMAHRSSGGGFATYDHRGRRIAGMGHGRYGGEVIIFNQSYGSRKGKLAENRAAGMFAGENFGHVNLYDRSGRLKTLR